MSKLEKYLKTVFHLVPIQKTIEAVVTNNVGYDFHTERYYAEDERGIIKKGIKLDANLMDHLEQLEQAHVFLKWDEYQRKLPLFEKFELYAVPY